MTKRSLRSVLGIGTLVLTMVFGLAAQTAAHGDGSRVVVTPGNTQGWSTADTRTGGAVNFVVDATAPSGTGALQLTTDATTTAKAQYLHAESTPLAGVTQLSYYTKQNSGPALAAPAYQLVMCLTGATAAGCNPQFGSTTTPPSSFTTLVFEPYQNPAQGAVLPTVWQQWDVDAGLFWSTRTVVCSGGTVLGTPGGPATYTLAQLKTLCPDALVVGFGVNIGSNNPSYDVETDLFNFNGTVYDFEPAQTCATAEREDDGDRAHHEDCDKDGHDDHGDHDAHHDGHDD